MKSFSVSNLTVDPPRHDEPCDRCGVPSSVAVLLVNEQHIAGRLTFCGHHYDLIPATYKQQAFKVVSDIRVKV